MARGGLTATHGAASTPQSLQTLAGGAIVVAALYFARDVLIPLALALLLTFLLAPAVLRLRRWGLGRIPAVMTTVVVAFSFIGLLGWVVTGQLLNLAYQLPSYQQNISQKLKSFDTPGEGLFERTGRMFSELNRDLSAGAAPAETAGGREPMPVTVQEPPASPLETIEAFVSPLLDPLATAGVVIVLVIFMLIGREDLRDRFIGLVGTSRMNVTTQALDDAGLRISRYLLMQFLVNVTYGVPIGVGLYFIGVPNALLWGVLATLLRFVPFLGPLIAMVLPLLLAFAVDPGLEHAADDRGTLPRPRTDQQQRRRALAVRRLDGHLQRRDHGRRHLLDLVVGTHRPAPVDAADRLPRGGGPLRAAALISERSARQ